MASSRLVLVFLALQLASAFRMRKVSKTGLKHIAGVPVYNYDAIHQTSFLEQGSVGGNSDVSSDWILMLKSDVSEEDLTSFCEGSSAKCTPEGHAGAIPFVEVHGMESELQELLERRKGLVSFVEPDLETTITPELPADGLSVQSSASWGLDRVGAPQRPNGGAGVHVYVLDTGLRTTHNDFGGRAIATLEVLGDTPEECQGSTSCAHDVNGHGTHCAGTVGGTTYGVAPKSTIHGMKVIKDNGSGSESWSISAIDWVMTSGKRPAVISMSLRWRFIAQAFQVAIDRATSSGVTVVVAAGNDRTDACRFSPAYVQSAITVGSTDERDSMSSFSNYGSCVDIWAPGSNIVSAGHRTDQQSATLSGTSMACPHVAGAAALLLESNPGWTSAEVVSSMLDNAVSGALSGLTTSDANKLLFVGQH